MQLIGGWHDIFLPWMLEDFSALQAAGRHPQLTIGPWTNIAPGLLATSLREGLAWLRARLLLDARLLREAPVRVFVTGDGEGAGWRDLDAWPPPEPASARYRWQAATPWCSRRLRAASTGAAPTAGKPTRAPASRAPRRGPTGTCTTPATRRPRSAARSCSTLEPVVDNRSLEERADVITYTTEPLISDLEAIGQARVELWVRASLPYFDVFARVCDVDGEGVSRNVCDALVRVFPGRFEQRDGAFGVELDLWPMGHSFAAGHRIRLQVSSGAHPRFARNPGIDHEPASATESRAVRRSKSSTARCFPHG